MNKQRDQPSAAILLLIWVISAQPQAAGWSSGQAVSGALSVDCIRPQVVGVCFWLRCVLYACSIEVSVKIGHYNPDLLVEASNPQGVNRSEGTHRRDHKNLIYKDIDAIGHPVPYLYCPSQTYPLVPYFNSTADTLAWRFGIPESIYPQALIPGLREIGNWPFNTWGAVYPRSGFTIQASEPKAAATLAQRAGDIVTRTFQPHVYIPVTGDPSTGDMKVWPPGELIENKYQTGDWQMLYPQVDPLCEAFGNNDTLSASGWGAGKVSTDGRYAWTLWRPYTCCEDEGIFLFSIDVISYPP